jgi:hypothetical protein
MASVRLHLALAAAIAGVLVYVYCIHREIKKLDVHINSLVASVKTLQSRLNEKDSASSKVVVNLPHQSPLVNNAKPSPAQLMEIMLGVSGLNETDAKRHGSPGGFVSEEEDEEDNDMSTFIANGNAEDTDEDDEDADVASSSISSGEVRDMMDKLDGLPEDDENAAVDVPEIADEVLVDGPSEGPSDASSSTSQESQNHPDLDGSPCMVESPDIRALPDSDEVEVEQEAAQPTTYAEYKLKSYKIDELKNILRNEFGLEPPKGNKEMLVKAILDAQTAQR